MLPDPMSIAFGVSALLAIPTLARAIYHGTRLEKCLHDKKQETASDKKEESKR